MGRDRNTFDLERMCRLNGQSPTARDRWVAFYRLYRITQRSGSVHVDMAAADCLRVLMSSGRLLHLVRSEGESKLPRSYYPKVIRQRLLSVARKKRLYGDGYHRLEGCRRIANVLRQRDGTECTPEEVAEVRCKIVRLAREKAERLGFVLPADDDAVLAVLKAARNDGGDTP